MTAKAQAWLIGVSPAERWELLALSFGEGQKLKGRQGRVFRRFMRALALEPLRDVLMDNANRYNPAVHRAKAPALFEVTAETMEYLAGLAEVEHSPYQEMVLGELFDLAEDLHKSGRDCPPPEGLAPYDPAGEDWSPPKGGAGDVVEETAQRIAAHLEAAGQAAAATLVRRGGWDAPGGASAAS